MNDWINKDELMQKLYRKVAFSPTEKPFTLHAHPHCQLDGFYSIGPILYGQPTPWIDMRINSEELYNQINQWLKEICRDLRLSFKDAEPWRKENKHVASGIIQADTTGTASSDV